MIHARLLVGVAALVALSSGCTSIGSKEHFMQKGVQKAAFDMQCEKEKLEVTELGRGSMGVRGCGKQGRYEYVHGAGWVLNQSGENEKK